MPLQGAFRALLLFDVAEEIDLEAVRGRFGERAERSPSFRLPAPEYVRFERPPVILAGEPMRLESGEEFTYTLKFFDYGVVSVELFHEFHCNWAELRRLGQRLIGSADIEQLATELARRGVSMVREALLKAERPWMTEDYYVFHLRRVEGIESAAELLHRHGGELAQLVRGENTALSDTETAEVLRGHMSYYPTDLLVAGWTAAVVFDNDDGADATVQLLEFANTQLLEFRFYDDVLSGVLRGAYRGLEARRGWLSRWRYAREAERLNELRLDVTDITERADNALKFIGDMFYARAYRLAAERVGVNDYRKLVDGKLKTAGELYEFMVNEFHHGRAFVLELAVVIILIIDLYFILREAKVI
jgi:hypothetical protein